jgi:preprotein translocase subunit SecG
MIIPILKVLFIIAAVICSFLLVGVILLQRAKGEGLGLAFGAQMGESLFGARASNVLVRITVWLGVIFLLSTTLLARIYARGQGRSLLERRAPIERKTMPVQPPVSPVMPVTQPMVPPPAQPVPSPAPTPTPPPPPAEPVEEE